MLAAVQCFTVLYLYGCTHTNLFSVVRAKRLKLGSPSSTHLTAHHFSYHLYRSLSLCLLLSPFALKDPSVLIRRFLGSRWIQWVFLLPSHFLNQSFTLSYSFLLASHYLPLAHLKPLSSLPLSSPKLGRFIYRCKTVRFSQDTRRGRRVTAEETETTIFEINK